MEKKMFKVDIEMTIDGVEKGSSVFIYAEEADQKMADAAMILEAHGPLVRTEGGASETEENIDYAIINITQVQPDDERILKRYHRVWDVDQALELAASKQSDFLGESQAPGF